MLKPPWSRNSSGVLFSVNLMEATDLVIDFFVYDTTPAARCQYSTVEIEGGQGVYDVHRLDAHRDQAQDQAQDVIGITTFLGGFFI